MFKTLIKSLREYKVPAILTPIYVTVEVIMECLLPFIMSKLIDNINNGEIKTLIIYSAILLACAMVALLFGFLSAKTGAMASCGFAKNLRKDVYYKIQDFSFENIDKFSASSLVTRLTTDISNVQMAVNMLIRTAVRVPLMIIISIVMAFIICPTLAWAFVIIGPILFFILFLIVRTTTRIFDKLFVKYDELNESVQENINAIRVVKSYVREDYEKEKFGKASSSLAKEFTHAEKIIALDTPAMQLFMNLLFVVVIGFGTYICVNTFEGFDLDSGEMITSLTAGELQSLLTYGIQVLSQLMVLSMIMVILTISKTGARRIVEVLNEKSTITNCENPIYEIKNGDIEFKNVSFKYSLSAEKNVLNNINLKIKSGQTVGIIGGTGTSKTSLVNLISRLYDVTEGELLVGGINVKDYDIVSLRDAVSVVLQKNVLFSGSIAENLRWGKKDATDEEIKEACHLACADEFIETFPDKYETHIEQGGTNVSGGQKQRLCIARALLKSPKILILDDSTSAVDTKTDAKIRSGMKKFIPDTTKIIIAQRLSSVENADVILVMDHGEIIASGTNDELLKTCDIYKEIYEIQNKNSGGNNDEK